MSEQKTKDKYEVLSVKIKPDQAVLLDAICNALGVNTYQIFQMFFYVLCKASAPMHELSPDIRKLMTLMETDASWAEAFNLANPNKLKVAQCILILEQEKKISFEIYQNLLQKENEVRIAAEMNSVIIRVGRPAQIPSR